MTYSMEALELRLATSWFIQRTIDQLADAGWIWEARRLEADYNRALRFMPDLLSVRDTAEHLLAVLEATR